MSLWLELVMTAGLIIGNGLFALAELAVLSANKTRLRLLAKNGSKGAAKALRLAENPDDFVPATQIAITAFQILAGVFSGAALSEKLGTVLNSIPMFDPHGEAIALPFVVVLVGYFTLLFGELLPKKIAISHAERYAAIVAPFMLSFAHMVQPLIGLLRNSNNFVIKILGLKLTAPDTVTEEEVKAMVEEGTNTGVFEHAEQQMIRRVLRLADRPVRAIMTARNDLDWLDVNWSEAEIVQAIRDTRHAAYPVCDTTPDHLLGVARSRDLLDQQLAGEPLNLRKAMHEPTILPETTSILSILERVKEKTIHMGFIVDEYGVLEGIVTYVDLMEAIVGALPGDSDVADAAGEPTLRHDGSWLLDGQTSIDEVKDLLRLNHLPGEENYHTLAGVMLHQIGRIPHEGDSFGWHHYIFEVVDMDSRRVDKVMVSKQPPLADEITPETVF